MYIIQFQKGLKVSFISILLTLFCSSLFYCIMFFMALWSCLERRLTNVVMYVCMYEIYADMTSETVNLVKNSSTSCYVIKVLIKTHKTTYMHTLMNIKFEYHIAIFYRKFTKLPLQTEISVGKKHSLKLWGPMWKNRRIYRLLRSPPCTKSIQRFSRAGPRGRAREWATLGVHPLSWLLSNNRLEEVCGTLTKGTFSSRLLLSNQDKGRTPSVAHSLPLPLPPGFCSTCQIYTYLRDTKDVIRKIEQLKIPKHCLLVAIDCIEMFTNVLQKEVELIRNKPGNILS